MSGDARSLLRLQPVGSGSYLILRPTGCGEQLQRCPSPPARRELGQAGDGARGAKQTVAACKSRDRNRDKPLSHLFLKPA